MKRYILTAVFVLISMLCIGCSPKVETFPVPEEQAEETAGDAAIVTDRLPDNILDRLQSSVKCFTVAPQEFDDPSELSDDAMVYAALLRYSSEFQPVEGDEYTYTLSLDKLPMAIHAVFGDAANLSDNYLNGNYYPYEISASQNLIYRYSDTIEDNYFYTESATETESGQYEIKLLNLRDPLFFEHYEDYLLEGNEVTDDLVGGLKDQMLTYVYTLEDTGNGMIITSFHYLNYKEIYSLEAAMD